MPEAKKRTELPNIQELKEGFPKRAIKKVGIREVKVPLKVLKKDGTINICSANISMYTDLSKNEKGTNMSRYRILIEEYLIGRDLVLHDFIRELLLATKTRLKQNHAYVKIWFPYYLVQNAPVSKITSHIEMEVAMEGKLVDDQLDLYLTVKAPYTSCCPCSKEISKHGAHNQRSTAEITVKLDESKGIMWIEDLYAIIIRCASAPIINGLKREDEKWQTELMYEQPQFVEDVVRHLGDELDKEMGGRILDYVVVVNQEESIHTHNAVAILNAGKELG